MISPATARRTFQSLRGWSYWSNHEEAKWHEDGSQQAVEIMQQMDRGAAEWTVLRMCVANTSTPGSER
jgi:hypothetical protein